MNGAITEPSATNKRKPRITIIKTIGNNHSFLLTLRNNTSSARKFILKLVLEREYFFRFPFDPICIDRIPL